MKQCVMHRPHIFAFGIFGVISFDHLQAISCPLYILITIKGISTKLHAFVNHIQTAKFVGTDENTKEVSPFPAVDHNAARTDKKARQTRNISNKNDPEKMHHLAH